MSALIAIMYHSNTGGPQMCGNIILFFALKFCDKLKGFLIPYLLRTLKEN